MRFTKVISFRCDGLCVDFVPAKRMPGYSHRVLLSVAGEVRARDWLADGRTPSALAAELFAGKHATALAVRDAA